VTIDQVASALLRRRLIFLITLTACLVAVVGVTVSLPKTYRATATLYVGDKGATRALEFNSSLGEALTRTYSTLAGNPNVAQEVLRELPLRLSRTELLSRMSFAPVERTQLLQVSAEGSTPKEAQLIANTYAKVYADRVVPQFRTGQTQSQVTVNEPAALPSGAYKPNPKLYIGLGTLLSLFLAIGAVLIRERLDKTIKIAPEEDTVLGHPVVGRIPRMSGPVGYAAPEVADAFRLLKTTLDFVDEKPVQTLMVTSPSPVEGKTSIATNLALADAADDEKVVLIEADLRRPGMAAPLSSNGLVRSEVGLTNFLVGTATVEDILVPHPDLPNLGVIWSGPTPPNPTTLLRSDRLGELLRSLRQRYDRIIIDTPPVSVGADASVVASKVDGTLYVIDSRNTTRSHGVAGLNQLKKVRAQVLGVVLNNTQSQSPVGYYGPRAPAAGGASILSARAQGRSRLSA